MPPDLASLRRLAEQATPMTRREADFYAACSPTTVLALLDTIERQRAALQEFIRLDEDCYLMVQTPNGNELVSALAAAQQALSQDEAGT